MPSGKEGEKPAAKAKKPTAEEEAKQKAAHQHALQVKKDHRKLKPKAFAKKFDEEISKVKEFEAEFKLLRLELLGKDLQSRDTGCEIKGSREGSLIQQEMRKVIESLEDIQPCWVWAMERCAVHLRQSINVPGEAVALCKRVIERVKDMSMRPVDDKMLTLVPGVLNDKEEELGYQKLLNLDRAEDRQYVVDRMRLQMYHAQMAEDQATMSMNSPQWREEVNRLQKSTHARKERLTQLYQQGVRKPEKISTAGNGVEGAGKEDEALKLKRQLIQQEVARAKARELCLAQNMDGMSEHMQVDDRMLRQQQQQVIPQQGPLTAQQERMHRRLAKRKDEEKQSHGTQEWCKDIKASAYVTELSPDDLKMSLRVECDKLWNQVLHAHSRLQEEQNSGIGFVHHIVAHTLNHPEARWLGRWYLGETFPFNHESQFLTIVSTLLWRTLVQTTKDRVVKRWEENESLKQLPWCGGCTPEEKEKAMHEYLIFMHNNNNRHNLETDLMRSVLADLADQDDQQGWPWEYVVRACHNLDHLHRACMQVFQDHVRNTMFDIQKTMEDRVPFIRELEQSQHSQVEHILNFLTDGVDHRFRSNPEFVFCFLKDRITFNDDFQWLLMHQVAQELEQHFKENPSHNQQEFQGQDVAVLGREVGFVHAIKERILDLAPHYEVYGSRDTQDMLVTIMKNGELDIDLKISEWQSPCTGDQLALMGGEYVNGTGEPAHQVVDGNDEAAGRGFRTFLVHGKGFDSVVNHHEQLEMRRRQDFYEKMDSFIKRGTQWAAQMKVYTQLETLYCEACNLRDPLVRLLLSDGGAGALQEQHGTWLQDFVCFLQDSLKLAESLHSAHTLHSNILVRRILCALWNKHMDERRYMEDEMHPHRKIEDMTEHVKQYSHDSEKHQKRMIQLRSVLMQNAQQVSASLPESAEFSISEIAKLAECALSEICIKRLHETHGHENSETVEHLKRIDESFAELLRFKDSIKEQASHFNGLEEELRLVTGPPEECVGQYHEVVRDIAVCIIREEMLKRAQEAELERAKRAQEEEAKRAQEDLLKDEEETALKEKKKEEEKAKKKAKEKEKKEKERLEKERIREEEEAKRREEEEKRARAAEEQATVEKKEKERKEALERERQEAEQRYLEQTRKEEERLAAEKEKQEHEQEKLEKKRQQQQQQQKPKQQQQQQQQQQQSQSQQHDQTQQKPQTQQHQKQKPQQSYGVPGAGPAGPAAAAPVVSEIETASTKAIKPDVLSDKGMVEFKEMPNPSPESAPVISQINCEKNKSNGINNNTTNNSTNPSLNGDTNANNVHSSVTPSNKATSKALSSKGSGPARVASQAGVCVEANSGGSTRQTVEVEKAVPNTKSLPLNQNAHTSMGINNLNDMSGMPRDPPNLVPGTPRGSKAKERAAQTGKERSAAQGFSQPQHQQPRQNQQMPVGSPSTVPTPAGFNKEKMTKPRQNERNRQHAPDAQPFVPSIPDQAHPNMMLGGGMGGRMGANNSVPNYQPLPQQGNAGYSVQMPGSRGSQQFCTPPPQGGAFMNTVNNIDENIPGPMMLPGMLGGMGAAGMGATGNGSNLQAGMAGMSGAGMAPISNMSNIIHLPTQGPLGPSSMFPPNQIMYMGPNMMTMGGGMGIGQNMTANNPHGYPRNKRQSAFGAHPSQSSPNTPMQQQQHQYPPFQPRKPLQAALMQPMQAPKKSLNVCAGEFVPSFLVPDMAALGTDNMSPQQPCDHIAAVASIHHGLSPVDKPENMPMVPSSPMYPPASPMHLAASPASHLAASPASHPMVAGSPMMKGVVQQLGPLEHLSLTPQADHRDMHPKSVSAAFAGSDVLPLTIVPDRNTDAEKKRIREEEEERKREEQQKRAAEEQAAATQHAPPAEPVQLVSQPVHTMVATMSSACTGSGLVFRQDQLVGTREYDLVWGPSHGEALGSNGEYSAQDLGKGLDNPKGEYNCFLNVIIQSLWQLEGFRDALTEVAELRPQSTSGQDSLALLKSLAHVFQLLSGTPGTFSKQVTPPSPARSPGAGGGGAWGHNLTSPMAGAWGSGGMGGRNLFVVDPVQCRAALSSIFSEHGRSQVNEMADAPEALTDVLEALGDDSAAGSDLISSSFSLNYVEDMECDNCRYKMKQQKNSTFFHLVFPAQLTEVTSRARFSPEGMLKEAYARESRECPECSCHNFTCSRSLNSCPNVFSLVLAWATTEATIQDIEALFKQLPLTLDLSQVYSGMSGPQRYRLRCMVCFYGQHYVLLAYKPRVRQWVQYDDTSVKAIGDWSLVEKRCKAGCYQPNIVFFERY